MTKDEDFSEVDSQVAWVIIREHMDYLTIDQLELLRDICSDYIEMKATKEI